MNILGKHLKRLSFATMNSIEENEEKNDIITVCKYLVANSVNNLPIKCSDITKNCLRGESRLLPKIIEKISDTIFDVKFLIAFV